MARGKKIDLVGEDHLGRLLVNQTGKFCLPILFTKDKYLDAIDEVWLMRDGGYYEWLPDTKPEERKPSQRVSAVGYRAKVTDIISEILDEHHDRLKKLEEKCRLIWRGSGPEEK